MAASTSSSEQSEVCRGPYLIIADAAKKLLPAALLMQKWVWFQGNVGMVKNSFVPSFRN